jgi:hypothetical protein
LGASVWEPAGGACAYATGELTIVGICKAAITRHGKHRMALTETGFSCWSLRPFLNAGLSVSNSAISRVSVQRPVAARSKGNLYDRSMTSGGSRRPELRRLLRNSPGQRDSGEDRAHFLDLRRPPIEMKWAGNFARGRAFQRAQTPPERRRQPG